MTDKERAEAYREAARYLDHEGFMVADNLRAKADELDPSTDTLDTSLRGWVMSENEGNRLVWWATEKGLRSDTDEDYGVWRSWDEVKRGGWTVRALTPEDIGYRVRKWDEWTAGERRSVTGLTYKDSVDLAIDIATRGNA